MRVVFCGTPEFAVPTLRRLLAEPGFELAGVITRPDRPRGRGLEPAKSPVKRAAREAALEIFQPDKIRDPEAERWLRTKAPDVVVLIAYGQIIPRRLLAIPRLGWINLHASLLPKYRGAAPIPWAIVNGETRTGLTTMQIDEGLDTGPILLRKEMEIGPEETAPELTARMAEAGAPLMVETLTGIERGELRGSAQNSAEASYAPMLEREDGRIDWTMTAADVYNRMRGFAPWPGAFAEFRGKLVHLWGRPAAKPPGASGLPAPGTILPAGATLFVACGSDTWLALVDVQPEGRRWMSAREFSNGARIAGGERFK